MDILQLQLVPSKVVDLSSLMHASVLKEYPTVRFLKSEQATTLNSKRSNIIVTQ